MELLSNFDPTIIAAIIGAIATIIAAIISVSIAMNRYKIKNSNVVSAKDDIKIINQTNKGDNNTFIGIQYNGKEQ